MPTVVDFLSRVYNAPPNVLGHFGFLVFNITNVLYLVLIQGYVFGRLQRDTLLKLALVGCLVQAISCSASIYTFNEAISADLLAGVCGIIAHASMNIAHVFVFFHREHRKFVKFGTGCIVVIAIYYMIGLNVHLSDLANGKGASARGMAPTDFFIASTIWQLVAIAKFRFDFTKEEIQYEDDGSRMPRETFMKLLTVIVVLEVISIAFEMSEIWVLAFSFSGFQYSLSVSVMIYVGTLDFMTGGSNAYGDEESDYDKIVDKAYHVGESTNSLINTVGDAKSDYDTIKGNIRHIEESPRDAMSEYDKIIEKIHHAEESLGDGKTDYDEIKETNHDAEESFGDAKSDYDRIMGKIHDVEESLGDRKSDYGTIEEKNHDVEESLRDGKEKKKSYYETIEEKIHHAGEALIDDISRII